MARHGPAGIAASFALAALFAFPAPAPASAPASGPDSPYAIRLPTGQGQEWPSLQIFVDDPTTSTAGPAVDVGATDFTIEAFIRGSATDNSVNTVECGANGSWIFGNVVFDRHRIGDSETRSFGVSVADGRTVFGVTGVDGSARTLCGSKNVVDGFWHHVAVQRRRSDGHMTIWVDGVLDTSADGPDGDVSYPDDALPPLCSGTPCPQETYLFIGGKEETPAASFGGSIDEIRISNVVRYTASFARPTRAWNADSKTAALYHFNEGSGPVARDSAGWNDARFGGGPPSAKWIEASPFGALPGNGRPSAATTTTPSARPTGSGQRSATVTATDPTSTPVASPAEAAARAIGRNRVGAKKGLPATLLMIAAALAALGFVVAMIVLGIRAAERT